MQSITTVGIPYSTVPYSMPSNIARLGHGSQNSWSKLWIPVVKEILNWFPCMLLLSREKVSPKREFTGAPTSQLWLPAVLPSYVSSSPGPCYQNNAMSYSNIESISLLELLFTKGGKMEWIWWCPLIVMKTHADIRCFETSVKMNTLVLAPNLVIRETELGPLAHKHNLCELRSLQLVNNHFWPICRN